MSNEIHFYASKTKIFMIKIALILFICGFGIMVISKWPDGDLFDIAVGIIGFIFFSFGLIYIWLEIFKFNPHLTLTERELVITPESKRALHIHWEDIEEIKLVTLMNGKYYGGKFIFIEVYNEEKYVRQMPAISKILAFLANIQNYSPIFIRWSLIKRKDRKKLIEELNRRAINSKTKINIEDV